MQDLDAWFDQRFERKMAEREAAHTPSMTIIATKGTLDMAYPPLILASTCADIRRLGDRVSESDLRTGHTFLVEHDRVVGGVTLGHVEIKIVNTAIVVGIEDVSRGGRVRQVVLERLLVSVHLGRTRDLNAKVDQEFLSQRIDRCFRIEIISCSKLEIRAFHVVIKVSKHRPASVEIVHIRNRGQRISADRGAIDREVPVEVGRCRNGKGADDEEVVVVVPFEAQL